MVLDLDETLVCAYESSSLPATLRAQAVEAGLHCFDMECISSEKASKLQRCAFTLSIAVFSVLLRKVEVCFVVYRIMMESRGQIV